MRKAINSEISSTTAAVRSGAVTEPRLSLTKNDLGNKTFSAMECDGIEFLPQDEACEDDCEVLSAVKNFRRKNRASALSKLKARSLCF